MKKQQCNEIYNNWYVIINIDYFDHINYGLDQNETRLFRFRLKNQNGFKTNSTCNPIVENGVGKQIYLLSFTLIKFIFYRFR